MRREAPAEGVTMRRSSPTGTLLTLTSAVAAALSGCMIPDYHQPQGFSSTYYRHLQQQVGYVDLAAANPAVLPEDAERAAGPALPGSARGDQVKTGSGVFGYALDTPGPRSLPPTQPLKRRGEPFTTTAPAAPAGTSKKF